MTEQNYHWYELKRRGISPGCQPDGFVDKDFNHGVWGAVAYDRELTETEIAEYELEPVRK